jgi:hypothetical protein
MKFGIMKALRFNQDKIVDVEEKPSEANKKGFIYCLHEYVVEYLHVLYNKI